MLANAYLPVNQIRYYFFDITSSGIALLGYLIWNAGIDTINSIERSTGQIIGRNKIDKNEVLSDYTVIYILFMVRQIMTAEKPAYI